VDRGGTFTDVVVLYPGGHLELSKVRSDVAIVGRLAQGSLCFGTTVATNALLERSGVRTLLVVNRGFEDLPWIGDAARPDIFDSEKRWPDPLCSEAVGVGGRIGVDGEIVEPLVEADIAAVVERAQEGFDSVAIALVNSSLNPEHEQTVAAALERHVLVSVGHRVSPEIGYLGRIETTLLDAAITPLLRDSMESDEIPENALAMCSDGGLVPAQTLTAPDAVLSGPAGGVLAVAAVARLGGFEKAVGLDMGGTSTDVCRVEVDRLPRREGETRVAGIRLRRPMLEVETIAAGGGSVLQGSDHRLWVGPESAGANPGPACYGRGGPQTLTDAALLMGLMDPEAFEPPLDPSCVNIPGEPAEYVEVAREAMAAAVHRIATSRGVDLSDHCLVSYGGAAGQHAAGVAEKLGICTVLVHPCAGVLCAWGQALATREESLVSPIWKPLDLGWADVEHAWGMMETSLPALGESLATVELRHVGCDHAIELEAGDPARARELFFQEHRRRYGFDRANSDLELVNARFRVRAPLEQEPPIRGHSWGIPEEGVEGPHLLTQSTTAIFVPLGWRARQQDGLLRLEKNTMERAVEPTEVTPFGVELWGNRFMSVAEQAGEVLRRLARSVNIRERLDFSCAVFDEHGGLVANAPHIPVHLGAMGETVRDLIAHVSDPEPGQAWLTNDPSAGGSHLPDLTVITAVQAENGCRFFVGSRAHHVDVGGITPGSMPPHSTRLDQEGVVLRRQPLLYQGCLGGIEPLLEASREPETVQADLEAQIAANAHAARLLLELGEPGLVATWMKHLQAVASDEVGRVISSVEWGDARDCIDGIELFLKVRAAGGRLVVDFRGTTGPHAGNLNAPPAVVRAAVLYGLRVLVGRPIPLNDGALSRVELLLPTSSILSAPPGAAIVGGNVETSQRITDLFLAAAGHRASSQGTMNNLTLGGKGWSLYETICGGEGASPSSPGASMRQVHMTNTRATDVEVLEARLPLRVRSFSRRVGSGGCGKQRGGDGVVREIEVLSDCQAALLATRRGAGAPGLHGGGEGAPGKDLLQRGGQWQDWDGGSVALAHGDRIRVETPGGGGWGSE